MDDWIPPPWHQVRPRWQRASCGRFVDVASDPVLWARTQTNNERSEGVVVRPSRARDILSHYVVGIRDVVVRAHPAHAGVQTLAMQLIRHLKRTSDQLRFKDDILSILLNPLVHTRESMKAALAVFQKENSFVADVFKPHPQVVHRVGDAVRMSKRRAHGGTCADCGVTFAREAAHRRGAQGLLPVPLPQDRRVASGRFHVPCVISPLQQEDEGTWEQRRPE